MHRNFQRSILPKLIIRRFSEGATVPVNGVTLGEAAAAAERQREAQNPFIPAKKG